MSKPDTIEFNDNKPDITWGEVTSTLINEFDWDQGGHARDPNGDGPGNDDRGGLANVVNQGDMQATTEFIADAFDLI